MRKALFLDRDGTLVKNVPYNGDPSRVELFSDTKESLLKARELGFLLVLCTNQSGIGRGLITEEDFFEVQKKFVSLLGFEFDEVEYCPHSPDEGCPCRKPKPGLIQNAAFKLHIDLSESYLIGDNASDILAGKAAGVKDSILVSTGGGIQAAHELEAIQCQPGYVAKTILDAICWIEGESILKSSKI